MTVFLSIQYIKTRINLLYKVCGDYEEIFLDLQQLIYTFDILSLCFKYHLSKKTVHHLLDNNQNH